MTVMIWIDQAGVEGIDDAEGVYSAAACPATIYELLVLAE
jgi:hypothetical protein